MKRLIIGLVGDPATGKTELAKYLHEQHGFFPFEGSDAIKAAAQAAGVRLTTRKEFSDFHTGMQRAQGQDVLARMLLARPEDRVVYAGLRSVHNAELLRRHGGVIVALSCPLPVCFERADHSGLKYEKTQEAFIQAALAERHSVDGYGANVQPVMDMADVTLVTSKPITETYRALDELVSQLQQVPEPSA